MSGLSGRSKAKAGRSYGRFFVAKAPGFGHKRKACYFIGNDKMRKFYFGFVASLVSLAALLALSPLASADEAWQTERGRVVYMADWGDTAILQLIGEDGEVRFYFPGLAGNFKNRDVHEGYWISTEPFGLCGGTLRGLDGFASPYFGRATLVFEKASFPSGWTMLQGFCWEDTRAWLVGTL